MVLFSFIIFFPELLIHWHLPDECVMLCAKYLCTFVSSGKTSTARPEVFGTATSDHLTPEVEFKVLMHYI